MTNVQFFFFFFFLSPSSMAKGETSFFVLYLLFEYTSVLYNLTYICPLARSLVRRVASAVDREKKEDEEEEYSPFLFVQNESFDHYFFLFYHRTTTIIPKNCSLSIGVHFLFCFALSTSYPMPDINTNEEPSSQQINYGELVILGYATKNLFTEIIV